MSEFATLAAAADNQDPDGGDPSGGGSRWRVVLRRAVHDRTAMAGAVLLVLLFALAAAGPYLTRWGYEDKDFTAFRQPPSARHWFGTGAAGQDVFAATMRGMRRSLVIGLLVAVVSTGLAAVAGAFAGYFLGAVDRVLMWVVDLLLVLPSFLMVAILSPLFHGATSLLFVALLAAFMWMVTARIIRGMTMSLREREYVLAARFMGVGPVRIIFRHILPNVSSLLIVDATINVSAAVMAESALSYFGFGVQPPDVSLGTLLADASTQATTYPWLFLFPAALLVLIVLSVNLVGDGLRDALDPASGKAVR